MDHKDFLNIPGAPSEELSAQQLKIGYWVAGHRVGLRKLGFALFIIFDVVLGSYNIYQWTNYFLNGYFSDQKSVLEIVQTTGKLNQLLTARAALPITIEGTTAYQSATGRFDAVALLQNPNKDWYVSFDFQFDVNNGTTSLMKGFLLPNEEKPVGAFNVTGASGSSEPSFKLSNIKWRRISKHDIPNISSWLSARNQFSAEQVKITSAFDVGLSEGRLSFDLINKNYYDYREPDFLIALWNGPTLTRVYKIHLSHFLAQETRNVEVAVPSNVPSSASIKVYPQIDFFDSAVYLK